MSKISIIGLSNKINCKPLDENTKSGKLVKYIEEELKVNFHKINLVQYAPIDKNGKLIKPTKSEMDNSIKILINDIKDSDVWILLGKDVKETFERYYKIEVKLNDIKIVNNKKVIYVRHPSYICMHGKKLINEYVENIKKVIE